MLTADGPNGVRPSETSDGAHARSRISIDELAPSGCFGRVLIWKNTTHCAVWRPRPKTPSQPCQLTPTCVRLFVLDGMDYLTARGRTDRRRKGCQARSQCLADRLKCPERHQTIFLNVRGRTVPVGLGRALLLKGRALGWVGAHGILILLCASAVVVRTNPTFLLTRRRVTRKVRYLSSP